MLLSKAREIDFLGNDFPSEMMSAEQELEELGEATIEQEEAW
jgi:hypothetical protein